jgi:hypothetical protein
MQDSCVFEPAVVKRLWDRVVPFDLTIYARKRRTRQQVNEADIDNEDDDEDMPPAENEEPATHSEAWDLRVEQLLKKWSPSSSSAQLRFAAEATVYVEQLRRLKASEDEDDQAAFALLPIFGPRFCPASAACYKMRSSIPSTADTEVCPVTLLIEDFSPSLCVLCPEGFSAKREASHRMSHQEWLKPRKFAGLLSQEYVVGEKLRCNACRNLQTKLRRQLQRMQQAGQTDIRDYLESDDAKRYPFTISTTSPAFRNLFNVMDFPRAFFPSQLF